MPGRNGPAPGSTSFDSTKTALTLTNTTEPGAKADVSVNSSTRTTVKAGEKGTLSMQLMRTNGSNGITPLVYDEQGKSRPVARPERVP
jgi:hypothetical protein